LQGAVTRFIKKGTDDELTLEQLYNQEYFDPRYVEIDRILAIQIPDDEQTETPAEEDESCKEMEVDGLLTEEKAGNGDETIPPGEAVDAADSMEQDEGENAEAEKLEEKMDTVKGDSSKSHGEKRYLVKWLSLGYIDR